MSSDLAQEKMDCPNFQIHRFTGQLRPTNVVARQPFQAIPGNRAYGVVEAWKSVSNAIFCIRHEIRFC